MTLAVFGIVFAMLTNSEVKPKNKGPFMCFINTFSFDFSLIFFSNSFSFEMSPTFELFLAKSPIFFIKNKHANKRPIPTA